MIDIENLTPSDLIQGDDDEDTEMLINMKNRSVTFIQSFDWCPPVKNIYFGMGVGNVIALFLFQFQEKIKGTDEFLWIVNGDLPSAYFVVDDIDSIQDALEAYCELMEDWCDAEDLDEVFPIPVPHDEEHITMLKSRLQFIRREIIPFY